MSTTIRVDETTRDRLSALAAEAKLPMTVIVDQALTALERQRFFEAFNNGYQRLRDDQKAWGSVEAEREIEDGTITDEGY